MSRRCGAAHKWHDGIVKPGLSSVVPVAAYGVYDACETFPRHVLDYHLPALRKADEIQPYGSRAEQRLPDRFRLRMRFRVSAIKGCRSRTQGKASTEVFQLVGRYACRLVCLVDFHRRLFLTILAPIACDCGQGISGRHVGSDLQSGLAMWAFHRRNGVNFHRGSFSPL
jgi:hypothetical protein